MDSKARKHHNSNIAAGLHNRISQIIELMMATYITLRTERLKQPKLAERIENLKSFNISQGSVKSDPFNI